MNSSNWKDVAELVGIAALVASLVFVGLQVRQDQDIAVAQIYADHDDTVIEWARLISENKDIWVRGLKGEALNDADRAVFVALASTYFMKEGDRYVRAILISPVPPDSITIDVAQTIFAYSPLEAIWESQTFVQRANSQNNSQIFQDYVRGVQKYLGQIRNGEIEPYSDRSFAPI